MIFDVFHHEHVVKLKFQMSNQTSLLVSTSFWDSLPIADQPTHANDKEVLFLTIFECFSLFWTMLTHAQACISWSIYTTGITANIFSNSTTCTAKNCYHTNNKTKKIANPKESKNNNNCKTCMSSSHDKHLCKFSSY